MKKKEKEKEKGKVRNSLVFYTHRLLQIYGHTIVGGCSTVETQSDTLDDLHSRSSKRQSQSQSILPVFCFSMLYPVVDVYATQHNIRRISRIFAFTRSYTNRQIIHPFSNKNLRRDSTTQHRPTIVLFFGHCSTVFDPYKLIIYIDIIRVVYTPTPSAY